MIGLGNSQHRFQQLFQLHGVAVPLFQRIVGAERGVDFRQIDPRTEGRAGTGQNHRTHLALLMQIVERLLHLEHHQTRQGIAFLGTLQNDRAAGRMYLDLDQIVHDRSPSTNQLERVPTASEQPG